MNLIFLSLLNLLTLIISFRKKLISHIIASLAFLSLPIGQALFFKLANVSSNIFVFTFTKESINEAIFIYSIVQLFLLLGAIFAKKTKYYFNFEFQLSYENTFKLSLLIIFTCLTALFLATESVRNQVSLAGRGSFEGIGIFFAFLTPTTYVLFRGGSKSLIKFLSITFSLLTSIYLSRIFFIISASVLIYEIFRKDLNSMDGYKSFLKYILISFTIISIFFYSGQLKHVLYKTSLDQSFKELVTYNPFEEAKDNLGFFLTYSKGVEAFSSMADCIDKNPKVTLKDTANLLSNLLKGFFPAFLKFIPKTFQIDDFTDICNKTIVQPAIQEFYKAWNYFGIIIYCFILTWFINFSEKLSNKKGVYQILGNLLTFNSFFLIRGTTTVFISISIGYFLTLMFLLKFFPPLKIKNSVKRICNNKI